MVLQRDKPNSFWGWTSPGEHVAVSIGDRHAETTAGSDGKWIAQIAPLQTGGPYTVVIDGSKHIELTDVMVGDDWICAGQSNMEFGITMRVSDLRALNNHVTGPLKWAGHAEIEGLS